MDRYPKDVLAEGWQKAHLKKTRDVPVELDMVIEVNDYCGAVVGWENGIVILEDRKGRRRGFPFGPGFLMEGQPVALRPPLRQGASKPRYTASGSRAPSEPERAKVALPSRIYVEGRHDAELVEKIWGDDLRHVGVVVEYLGGIDDLPRIVEEFRPEPGRRLGVLVDHLVAGSKESRIARQIRSAGYADTVLILGHEFVDIWQAVRPERIGRTAWPTVPRDVDFKLGTLAALGLPHANQADIARGWQAILARVRNYRDLEPQLNTIVETLIDFVTQDHHDQ
ncbi:DUF3097 domain-containing protein [Tessaracoccus sp. OH4464_COT-324]|uniref:DUF3097 domain-containing protein n=1 Tax=Tessaracoccus sp. OH4464_COT-324 TaxID=2491059 RepID=UPI000F637B71|nr:DUF3097 domain-containing protein [Tessaracoccus sp. OH4464_COT-324]RRD47818.1 DUF3097 domain-containing protein [Tessaracoccus sp. OH4464_COT-324]